jgi:hypothetical protein
MIVDIGGKVLETASVVDLVSSPRLRATDPEAALCIQRAVPGFRHARTAALSWPNVPISRIRGILLHYRSAGLARPFSMRMRGDLEDSQWVYAAAPAVSMRNSQAGSVTVNLQEVRSLEI